MTKTILVGNGYWGSKIYEKLLKVSNLLSVQSSKDYDPNLFEKADWVFVATPMSTHYKIVKDCLYRGVNVFVEKPFTSSLFDASELVSLAKERNKLLYIDNVFLHRDELLSSSFLARKNIRFIWRKSGPFNDTLINDLLYHDLYILISKIGYSPIEKLNIKINESNLFLAEFQYGELHVVIDYNRISSQFYKTIILDDVPLRFLNQDQDPLFDIINKCLTENHDFALNNELNLLTMQTMDFIRKFTL
jgi:hypothetical protein